MTKKPAPSGDKLAAGAQTPRAPRTPSAAKSAPEPQRAQPQTGAPLAATIIVVGGASLGAAWRLFGVPGANGLGTAWLAESLPAAWVAAAATLSGLLALAILLLLLGGAFGVAGAARWRAMTWMGAPLLLAWLPGVVAGWPGLPRGGIWVTQWNLLLLAGGCVAGLALLLWEAHGPRAVAVRAFLTDSSRGRRMAFVLVMVLAAATRLICAPPMLNADNPLYDPTFFHNDDRNDNLVQGGQIAQHAKAHEGWVPDKVFEHGPLYVYFVAAVTAVSNNVLLTSYVVQLVLGCLAAGLVFLAADRLIGRGGALAAGSLAALYAPTIYYETLLIADSITPLFFALLLWLGARHEAAGGRWRWWGGAALLGVMVGCISLLRPNLALTGVGLAAWLIFARTERPAWRRVAVVAVIAVVALAVVTPISAWMTQMVHRTWRNPCFVLPPGRVIWKFAWATDAQPYFYSPVSEQMHSFFSTGGWWLAFRKIHLLWAWFDSPDLCNFHLYSRLSPPLFANPVTMRLLSPLALVGIAMGVRQFRRFSLLYAILLAVGLAQVLFYISGRYRAALAPTLFIFAGLGAQALGQAAATLLAAWRDRSAPRGARALGVWLLLLAAAAWVNLYDPSGNHSMWHSDAMFGNYLSGMVKRSAQAGDNPAAFRFADEILWVANPDYQINGNATLAQLSAALGQTEKARHYSDRAQAIQTQRLKDPVLDKSGGRHFPPTSDWVGTWPKR
jgi:hypothetical protein